MSTTKVIWVILATVVIFAAGVVTGGFVARQTIPPRGPAPGYFSRFESARRAVNQLDLTPEQRLRIDRIIRDSQDQIADYFQILEPDLAQTFRQMRQNIRAELTAAQRRAFEDRMQRWRERNPARGGPRPGLRPKDSPAPSQPAPPPGR